MSAIGAINAAVNLLARPHAELTSSTGGTNSTNGSTNGSSSAAPNNELTGNSFIQLLTAQLRQQDPLNPVDPTTFVTQLVQFNQLEQLIQINSTLTGASGTSTPAGNAQA